MNFQGKAVLAYLEEDNTSRSYFRIQPLMTQDGAVNTDIAASFPDDGFLRIVPDKNEQHTFKDRMRSLCGLCIMDLRLLSADANKIRTNKNYSPARGENNQYIVYSDAVRTIPEDLLYQVVAESNVKNAATPFVYVRNGANIQGPFRREDGQPQGDTTQLPPDSVEIHSVTLGGGQELLFYWPRQAEEVPTEAALSHAEPVGQPEAPQTAQPEEQQTPELSAYEQIQDLNAGPSENANRLDTAPAAALELAPEQPQKPLTGTRLYQAPQRAATPRRAHNPLIETVEQQRYAARYEAPGAVLPQSAQLREVANPMDALKRALQEVWRLPETQRQAVDVLLSQPGMRPLLSKFLATEGDDLTLAAMRSQLQELEAERLMTLMQLDDAKKSLSATREEAIGRLNREEQKKLDTLRAEQQKAQEALEQLKTAAAALDEKCQEDTRRVEEMCGALDCSACLLHTPTGIDVSREELIERVDQAMRAAGFALEEGDALTLLTTFALAGRDWELCADTQADALAGLCAFAAALGVDVKELRPGDRTVVLSSGDAPILLLKGESGHPLATHVRLDTTAGRFTNGAGDYETHPYSSLSLTPSQTALPQALPAYPPVRKDCLQKVLLKKDCRLGQETNDLIAGVRQALLEAGTPLALATADRLCRFIAATQNVLKGGVAEAIDRGVCAYVIPHLLAYRLETDGLLPLLAAMPRTLKALKKA